MTQTWRPGPDGSRYDMDGEKITPSVADDLRAAGTVERQCRIPEPHHRHVYCLECDTGHPLASSPHRVLTRMYCTGIRDAHLQT